MTPPKWTQEETDILLGSKTIAEAIISLPRRTKRAIGQYAYLSDKKFVPYWHLQNENIFDKWSEHTTYILGYWFADGCLTQDNKINFSSKDKEHLEKIRTIIGSNHKISSNVQNGITYHALNFKNKKMCSFITSNGGTTRKSLTAKFPSNIPKRYIHHFIRGYFDGDGAIILNKNNLPVIVFSGTYEMLVAISGYFNTSCLIRRSRPKDMVNTYYLEYRSENAQKILSIIYNNATLSMKRKYKRFLLGMRWERKYFYGNKCKTTVICDKTTDKNRISTEVRFFVRYLADKYKIEPKQLIIDYNDEERGEYGNGVIYLHPDEIENEESLKWVISHEFFHLIYEHNKGIQRYLSSLSSDIAHLMEELFASAFASMETGGNYDLSWYLKRKKKLEKGEV